MKKIFLLAAVICLCVSLNAQDHLAFQGLPIDGTLQEFTQKMVEKDFTYKGTENGIATFTGYFAGSRYCTVSVSTPTNKDRVNMVSVVFEEEEYWSYLANAYRQIKNMLIEKYGAPSQEVELIKAASNTDMSYMYALEQGDCEWATTFSTDLGDIQINIISLPYSRGTVMLKYYDKKNSDNVRSVAMDDL